MVETWHEPPEMMHHGHGNMGETWHEPPEMMHHRHVNMGETWLEPPEMMHHGHGNIVEKWHEPEVMHHGHSDGFNSRGYGWSTGGYFERDHNKEYFHGGNNIGRGGMFAGVGHNIGEQQGFNGDIFNHDIGRMAFSGGPFDEGYWGLQSGQGIGVGVANTDMIGMSSFGGYNGSPVPFGDGVSGVGSVNSGGGFGYANGDKGIGFSGNPSDDENLVKLQLGNGMFLFLHRIQYIISVYM